MSNTTNNGNSGDRSPVVDITNCDREPIHVPGSVQPHGVLLAMDEEDLRIVQISSNSSEYLGMDPTDLLGNPISILLGSIQMAALRDSLASKDIGAGNPLKLSIGEGSSKRIVNGILHRHQGIVFLEMEPIGDETSIKSYQNVQKALRLLEKATSLSELWKVVVDEVRSIIGYDRVMIYRFDRVGNGTVVEESVVDGKETYLGLHYPASDIPYQARILYSMNYTRHVADVNYKASELIPLIYPVTRDLTDLSYSTLRSVSPMHVEYLQNMGVGATFSISIMKGATLWGLIACHHYSPKFIPFEQRSSCELLGQVISMRMTALEESEQTAYKTSTNILQAKFLEALSYGTDLKTALLDGEPNLLGYVPSGGCAICMGNEIYSKGEVPTNEQLTKLLRRLRRFSSPVFATDNLYSAFAEALEFKDVASGVLSATLSKEQQIYLMWFRPEQVKTVNWGGDPNKSVSQDNGMRLHPRKSFELWKEVVRNKSVPWTQGEIESVTSLRSTIMGLLLNWKAREAKGTA